MQTIGQLMTSDPVCCPSSTKVAEAARLMRDQNIGNVLVVDDDNLVGIVTDRDLVVRGLANGQPTGETSLGHLATTNLVRLKDTDDTDAAVALMREHRIRRVPVCNKEGRLVGVVSLGDLAVDKDPGSALADISKEPSNN